MTPDEVRGLADDIELVLATPGARGTMLDSGALVSVQVGRQGTAVTLSPDQGSDVRHVMAPPVARDLVRILRKAAAKQK